MRLNHSAWPMSVTFDAKTGTFSGNDGSIVNFLNRCEPKPKTDAEALALAQKEFPGAVTEPEPEAPVEEDRNLSADEHKANAVIEKTSAAPLPFVHHDE